MFEIRIHASSSKGNFYSLHSDNSILLIEAGISIAKIKKALNYDMSRVAGCLISHEHKDHSLSVKDLINLNINCYMSPGTKKALQLDSKKAIGLMVKKNFYINAEWSVTSFKLEHDAIEPVAFLITNIGGASVLFITDTCYFRYRLINNSLDYIIIEANYASNILNKNINNGIITNSIKKRIMSTHFEIDRVKDFFISNKFPYLKSVVLAHLSEKNSDESEFKQTIEKVIDCKVYVANKPLTLSISEKF